MMTRMPAGSTPKCPWVALERNYHCNPQKIPFSPMLTVRLMSGISQPIPAHLVLINSRQALSHHSEGTDFCQVCKSIQYYFSFFDGWRVLHSADWGSLLSAFQVLTGCKVFKVPDLSAIQPYSWDLLRSVFKLFKLGRLVLVLPSSQAWHDTLLLIMSIVPTELFNVSRLEAWHVKRVCLLRCPRGCEIMNISSSV